MACGHAVASCSVHRGTCVSCQVWTERGQSDRFSPKPTMPTSTCVPFCDNPGMTLGISHRRWKEPGPRVPDE